jgi:hypothetical protein
MDYFSSYLTAVEGFTRRELTRESDSLKAFIGMIEKFRDNHEAPIYQIWGIPFPGSLRISSTDCIRFFAMGLS